MSLLFFAVSGDPNGEGLPVWRAADGSGRLLEFGDRIAERDGPYEALYEIFDEMYGFGR